jgi:hypothetical protein
LSFVPLGIVERKTGRLRNFLPLRENVVAILSDKTPPIDSNMDRKQTTGSTRGFIAVINHPSPELEGCM